MGQSEGFRRGSTLEARAPIRARLWAAQTQMAVHQQVCQAHVGVVTRSPVPARCQAELLGQHYSQELAGDRFVAQPFPPGATNRAFKGTAKGANNKTEHSERAL
jgi:hypothetical protein